MSSSLLQPLTGTSTAATLPQPYVKTSSNTPSTAVIVIIIILLTAVVSGCIYVLFRYLSDRFHHSVRTFSISDDVPSRGQVTSNNQLESNSVLLKSLPLFRFQSVKGNLTGGDCAVCLSKFEQTDQLRLLPLCCHAFHAECIDTWIKTNQTCPLCRSSVLPVEESDTLNAQTPQNRSFRIEIGNISSRQSGSIVEESLHSYSVGSNLDYIVNENGFEISIRTEFSDITEKESSIGVNVPEPPGEFIACDQVAGGRSWLRDYVDMLTSVSFSSSFRSSGRLFSGSSRRTDPVADEDLEANQAGEEISELFRWLSGI